MTLIRRCLDSCIQFKNRTERTLPASLLCSRASSRYLNGMAEPQATTRTDRVTVPPCAHSECHERHEQLLVYGAGVFKVVDKFEDEANTWHCNKLNEIASMRLHSCGRNVGAARLVLQLAEGEPLIVEAPDVFLSAGDRKLGDKKVNVIRRLLGNDLTEVEQPIPAERLARSGIPRPGFYRS